MDPRYWVPVVMEATIAEAASHGATAIMFVKAVRAPWVWQGQPWARAYFDASGTGGEPVTTMAAVVSTPERWGQFWPKWQRVLDDPKYVTRDGRPLREAHYSAAISQRPGSDYEGWSDECAQRFLDDLCGLMDKHVAFAVSLSVVNSDYDRIIGDVLPKRDAMRDPYLWVMHSCLEEILKSELLSSDVKIYCEFDAGHRSKYVRDELKTQEYFLRLTDPSRANPELGPGFLAASGRFIPKYVATDSINSPPIQAADIMGGATRRGTTHHINGQSPDHIIVDRLTYKKMPLSGGWFDARALETVRRNVFEITASRLKLGI